MEPLRLAFTVACPPERAFALWASDTTRWWPHGHSVSGEPGLTVTFEPRPGGRIFERTPGGVEHDWGEVVVWEPPRRPVYLWHLRFDRADATEVEVRFDALDDGTAVSIEHRGWERLGAVGVERRERMRAAGPGWLSAIGLLAQRQLRLGRGLGSRPLCGKSRAVSERIAKSVK